MSLSNYNPETLAFLDGLISARYGDPEKQPSREVFFRDGVKSTYVLTADWPEKQERWDSPEAIAYGYRKFNTAEYLIDGYPTFAAMLEAIETANKPEHFIILIGWALNLGFVLVNYKTKRTSLDGLTGIQVLKKKTEEGVKVRVLLWNNSMVPTEYSEMGVRNNLLQKEAIDKLNPAAPAPEETPRRALCILDDNTRMAGAHHQKILLVWGSKGLIGFFGGIDVNSDRVHADKARFFIGKAMIEVGAPLHDVHARVTGQAAVDLLTLAINRWRFARPVRCYVSMKDAAVGLGLPVSSSLLWGHDPALPRGKDEADLPKWGGDIEELTTLVQPALDAKIVVPEPIHTVRVGQTVGNPTLASKGTATAQSDAWKIIRHGIRTAKKFIYVEDQYFWSKPAAEELAAAMPNIQFLIVMVTSDDADPSSTSLRRSCVDRLFEKIKSEDDKQKVGIYNRKEQFERYIHAKMLVIDDELAIIGSANMNNRGYTHDSEVIGAITDPNWDEKHGPRGGHWYRMELNLAHKLRVQLWAEHLKVPWTRLWDPIAARYYWENPPAGANVMRYPYKAGTGSVLQDAKDLMLDPIIWDPEGI